MLATQQQQELACQQTVADAFGTDRVTYVSLREAINAPCGPAGCLNNGGHSSISDEPRVKCSRQAQAQTGCMRGSISIIYVCGV
jgi:hypothetical protein